MKNLIFFDTETTQKTNSRLVQLAYSDEGIDLNELFFKPAEPITIEAMEVHHITEEQVMHLEPVNPEKLQPLFDGKIAVAHNAPFDIAVMAREGVKVGEYIDTLKVAQHLLPELQAHRLQYLRYSLSLKTTGDVTAHDAGGDVKVLIALFNHLQYTAMALFSLDENGAVEKMLELTHQKTILKKLPFGKFKDQLFSEVAQTSVGREYFRWLRGQSELGEDLKNTLDFYLTK